MRDDDPDLRPKKPLTHELGQDLTYLSEGELRERIELLAGEIARLDEEARRKAASRDAASAFFR